MTISYLSCLLWLLVLIQTLCIFHLGLEEDCCRGNIQYIETSYILSIICLKNHCILIGWEKGKLLINLLSSAIRLLTVNFVTNLSTILTRCSKNNSLKDFQRYVIIAQRHPKITEDTPNIIRRLERIFKQIPASLVE